MLFEIGDRRIVVAMSEDGGDVRCVHEATSGRRGGRRVRDLCELTDQAVRVRGKQLQQTVRPSLLNVTSDARPEGPKLGAFGPA